MKLIIATTVQNPHHLSVGPASEAHLVGLLFIQVFGFEVNIPKAEKASFYIVRLEENSNIAWRRGELL